VPQDYLCEEQARAATGLTVREHQELALASYLWLVREFPMLQWIPVPQGESTGDRVRTVSGCDTRIHLGRQQR